MNDEPGLKDEILWNLSCNYNVARFVSFDPNLILRHSRISSADIESAGTTYQLIDELLKSCGSVNIRTFLPGQASGNPFVYGLTSAEIVVEKMTEFGKEGYFCLVNETISINDGGVSGVVDQGIVEFSPDDTPRAVEKPGVCALPLDLATEILRTVYGIQEPIPFQKNQRIEFSLHPNRVGVRHERVLVWEAGPSEFHEDHQVFPTWPNNFSRHIGDKVFGLLIADSLELPIPRGTVVGRRVAPFTFGESTGSGETWIRTCPLVQEPGRYTTTKEWLDPFALMNLEDPENKHIQALIFQEAIEAKFSGATIPSTAGPIIEGIAGNGDRFMSGVASPQPLPPKVIQDIETTLKVVEMRLGSPVRIEWVHDGERVWIVQLHTIANGVTQYPPSNNLQEPSWLDFDPDLGIGHLSKIIELAKQRGGGVRVTKSIGVTSHIGDLLRKNRVPFKIQVSF